MKRALVWKLLERFGVQGIQFILQIILARLLLPEHYGVLAIMIIFTTLANVFIQNGFSTSLIQNKDVTEEDFSSVLWVTLLTAVVFYGIIFVFSPVIAQFYNMPELTSPLRVLALMILPGALNSVQLAKLSREMDFKKVFLSNIGAKNITFNDMDKWVFTNVTSLKSFFHNCSQLYSVNLSNFDTSNVTDMSYMFGGCSLLSSIDVSNFDTSNVTTMADMFKECRNLTSLDVTNFDTSNVTDMSYMFCSCQNIKSLDVSNFNTSNVTTMSSMFRHCDALETLDLSTFDTSNVNSFTYMFVGCDKLTTLNLYGFTLSSVTDKNKCDSMFDTCPVLSKIIVDKGTDWSKETIAIGDNMFRECPNLPNYGSIWTINRANTIDGIGYFTGIKIYYPAKIYLKV